MIKRSFFGLTKPRFEYDQLGETPVEVLTLPAPKTATFYFEAPADNGRKTAIQAGDQVRTGQKLSLYDDPTGKYVISSVTGTVTGISDYTGNYGQHFKAVSVKTAESEELADPPGVKGEPDAETVRSLLQYLPGSAALMKPFSNDKKPVDIIVVCGIDKDLLIKTNQHVIKNRADAVTAGVSLLKKVTAAHHVVIALPKNMMRHAGGIGGASGVELREIGTEYPAALPHMIAKEVLGKILPAGSAFEDMGVTFVSAEAVASLGEAARSGRAPVTKILTLIKKDMKQVMVEARIGTPLSEVFNACEVTLNEKDRIIVGGPMTGDAVFTADHPVLPDTDAVMVQDSEDIILSSDSPCMNCGECIRICPANVPVSMLVRFCEAGQYEAAADEYDLYACIECGLCSFVCTARMPIFQYIKLAKYELGRMKESEEANA